jgi:hypothetical protein
MKGGLKKEMYIKKRWEICDHDGKNMGSNYNNVSFLTNRSPSKGQYQEISGVFCGNVYHERV